MTLRFLTVFFLSIWNFFLFASSVYPTEPRKYVPPSSVPQSSYMESIDLSLYRSKFETPIPDWLQETVESELANFKKNPITQRALDATYNQMMSSGYPRTNYIRRYRVIGDRIYAYGIYETETDLIMRTLARLSDFPGIPALPNVDFMVNHNDGMPMFYDPPTFWITENPLDQAPVLSGGKRIDAPYVVLIPHRTPMPAWNDLFHSTLHAQTPWKEKIRSACWRGNIALENIDILSSSDQQLLLACAKSPRYLICSFSSTRPDLVNAGFTSSLDWIPSTVLRNVVTRMIKGHLPHKEHIRYAYLPILDGAMISGGGYEWRLLSNSVVFKPNSPNVTWFERGLKPYVHYIPIQAKLEDLFEKIMWARLHDSQCEQIANNGALFAMNHLTIEGLYFYLLRLMEEYKRCQAFNTEDLLSECESNPKWVRIR